MDVIRYTSPGASYLLGAASVVSGLTSGTWIERYDEPGEFSFKSPWVAETIKQLPLGALVSHVKTAELMLVTEHAVTNEDGVREVTVKGRGFLDILKQRYVGTLAAESSPVKQPYVVSSATPDAAILKTIYDHIIYDSHDVGNVSYIRGMPELVAFNVVSWPAPAPAPSSHIIDDGTVWRGVEELLNAHDLGIRVLRPGSLSFSNTDTIILIHNGQDLTKSVKFDSFDQTVGVEESVRNTNELYTHAFVKSTWFRLSVKINNSSPLSVRQVELDVSYLDAQFDTVPDGQAAIYVLAVMQYLGQQAIRARRLKAYTSGTFINHRYVRCRVHYNVGDLVGVVDSNGDVQTKRVVEFVETFDKTEETNCPTFREIEETQ